MTDPTPTQALLLFGLLARHGESAQKDLLPAVKKADREALAKAKLIEVGKVGQAYKLTLTDAGWAWAGDHLTAELPPAQRALYDLLARIGEHLARNSATLADLVGSKPEETPSEKLPAKPKRPSAPKKAGPKRKPHVASPRKRIEAAYLKLTGGRKNRAVRLAHLRAEFSDLDRAEVDAALGRILKGDATATLMRNDDPRQLDQADRDAAFSPNGEPFHLIWIEP